MTRRAAVLLGLLIALLSSMPAAAQQDPWKSVRTAAEAQLQRRPKITAQALRAALIALDEGLAVQVIRLDARGLLVAVQRQERGEVFIVALEAADASIAWSARLDAARGRPTGDPLNAWRRDIALAPTLIDLPSRADRERRFAINAVYGQAIGTTAAAQLSVWRWTGGVAKPLFVTVYDHLLSDDAPVALAGDVLRIREKGKFKTFTPCGACAERRLMRMVALTDAGAEDRGPVELDPDLALIDAMLDRLLKRQHALDNVDPQVVERLRPLLAGLEAEPSDGAALGGLNGWASRGGSAGRTVCLATDKTGALYFTLRGRGETTRVTAVRLTPDVGCDAA